MARPDLPEREEAEAQPESGARGPQRSTRVEMGAMGPLDRLQKIVGAAAETGRQCDALEIVAIER